MKNLKKVLALVTMFTMLLGVAVSAGTLYPDVDDNASYAEAVETLNVLGIMIGDDQGAFNPDASITRAEAAAIVTRMKALNNAASAAGGTNFTDVAADHWAAGYVNLAEQSGIINGYGDGTFGPSDPVTYEQIVKMIVAALGRTPEAEAMGGYPSGYLIVAAQQEINLGVSVTAGADAPRAAVARLVFNALEVKLMEQTGFTPGEPKYEFVDKNLLEDYLKVEKYEGIIESTYLSEGKVAEDDEKIITLDCKKLNGEKVEADDEDAVQKPYEGDTNAAALLGFYVSAYAKENEDGDKVLLGATKKSGKNDVLELTFADLAKADTATGDVEYYENASSSKTTEIEVAFDQCFYNGSKDTNDEVEKFLAKVGVEETESGVLTLIDNDPANEGYEVVMLKKADEDMVVGSIDAEEMVIESRTGNKEFECEDEDTLIKFYKADGSAAEFADVAEGNVLTFYKNAAGNIISVYISDVKIEGKVTESFELKGETVYTIGDASYPAYTTLGYEEGTFYVNVEGKIVDKVATAASGSYAYLYNAGNYPERGEDSIWMTYLTSDGEWVDNELADTVTVINAGENKGSVSVLKANNDAAFNEAFDGFLVSTTVDSKRTVTLAEGYAPLFQFGLDKNGEISKLYIGTAAENDANALSMDIAVESETEYVADEKSLGDLFFNDESLIFSVKPMQEEANKHESKKDITLTKASTFFVDGAKYDNVYAYDVDAQGVPAIVVANYTGSTILPGTNLLVITRIAKTTNEDGEDVLKLYGLQNGEEVSGTTVAVNELEGDTAPAAGDVAIFSVNADGAVDNIDILVKYADAKAAIAANAAGVVDTTEADDDAENIFGYVASTENGLVKFTDAFLGANIATSRVSLNTVSGTIYEINTVKDTPSFDTISSSKIEATDDYEEEAHWMFVRKYNNKVVDIVVYKTVSPAEDDYVAAPAIAVAEGFATITCATEGADIYYYTDVEVGFVEYTEPVAVNEGDVIVAYAAKAGMINSAEVDHVVTAAEAEVEVVE